MFDRRVRVDPVRWGERWSDPWRVYWAQRLRDALQPAARAFASLLGLDVRMVGVVPAVYFTRLRMGSVPFLSWVEDSPDVELAFPWGPTAALPPFTCFANPIAREEENRFALITRLASIVDGLLIGERRVVPRSNVGDLAGARAGTFSWSDDDRTVTVVDEWILRDAGIRRTTTAFVLPPLIRRGDSRWVPYVPLLYFQSAAPYDVEEAEAVLRAALATAQPNDGRATRYAGRVELQAIRGAILMAAQAAHVRAREWVNQKTQLLSRAGFEGLKDDLQRRIALGEEYASVFFDIDHFKRANERFKYDGADLLAAALTDRVLAYTHAEVAGAFAMHADAREETRTYAPTSPDGFRALLAHVSGDEFRFFIRTGTAREPSTTFDELDAMAFTEGLVKTVAMKHASPGASTRASRALLARSAAQRNLTRDGRDERILRTRATISAGVAIPRWRQEMTLADIQAVLNRSDLVAETAAGQAKNDGRNRTVERHLRTS